MFIRSDSFLVGPGNDGRMFVFHAPRSGFKPHHCKNQVISRLPDGNLLQSALPTSLIQFHLLSASQTFSLLLLGMLLWAVHWQFQPMLVKALWTYLLVFLPGILQYSINKQVVEYFCVKPFVSCYKCNLFMTLGVILSLSFFFFFWLVLFGFALGLWAI